MANKNAFQKLSAHRAKVLHFLEMTPLLNEKRLPGLLPDGNAHIKQDANVGPGADNSGNEPQSAPAAQTDDYIVRPFRLLSGVILSGSYIPVDYSNAGVLEKAVSKFGRTLFTDHNDSIRNALGSVVNPRYNSATTPPGIDGDLNVLANPRDPVKADIAKLFADGHLNRCSVSIIFDWQQSHPEMDEDTFWCYIGTEVNNQLVRIVVTNICQIVEISLVYFGADETAGSLDNEEIKHSQNHDVKDLKDKQDKEKEVYMDEKLALIKAHYKRILNRDFTTDIELAAAVEATLNELAGLKTEKQSLETQVTGLQKHKAFEEKVTADLRAEVLNLARAFNPQLDADDLDRYANAGFEKLGTYKAALENKVKLQCNKCGSHDIARRSSIEEPVQMKDEAAKGAPFAPIKMP
jgi:hypothetical protein